MLNIDISISLDKAITKERIRAGADYALSITGNQALGDINEHVPHDQEILRGSGITNSDKKAENKEFVLRWHTPYAKYLFHGEVMYGNPTNRTYGPEKLRFTEALARMEWTEYAAEKYGDNWQTVFQKALEEELGR